MADCLPVDVLCFSGALLCCTTCPGWTLNGSALPLKWRLRTPLQPGSCRLSAFSTNMHCCLCVTTWFLQAAGGSSLQAQLQRLKAVALSCFLRVYPWVHASQEALRFG